MRSSKGLEVALRVAKIDTSRKLRMLGDARAQVRRISERLGVLVRNSEEAAQRCAPAAGSLCSAAELVQAQESRLATLRLRAAEDACLTSAQHAEAQAIDALTTAQARARAYTNALERRRSSERRTRNRRASRRLDEQNLRSHEEAVEESDHARSA